ncbi:MAG TPA: type IV toxin-antitoxin system AbiEi family antitoxin [Bryobacteraceae bacterium]|nr:type IV toxin-antitoxin system AbiEi family antitoxin [Bryobacteraceae bacterium]
MKDATFEREAADRLLAALREIPFLASASIRRESPRSDSRADFIIAIRAPKIDRRLVCEVESSGQPRVAREACMDLVLHSQSSKRDYPVFIAPYISPVAAAICEDLHAGYFDLAGNCRLAFDQVYIRREGFPNPSPQKRDLRSLYSPKAERVLRVLLAAGKRAWRMQELADQASVSLGQVANVKKLLDDREWTDFAGATIAEMARVASPGFCLHSLESAALPILTEWAQNYRSERSTASEHYSSKPIPQIEAELATAGKRIKGQLAFSGFSGAARFAPAVRYQRVTAYVLGDIPKLADRLGLKPVPSGANITLLEPYDEGVFYGTKEVEGAPVVSPIQLYLDLAQTKGRGEEAASAILEQVIKPLWR